MNAPVPPTADAVHEKALVDKLVAEVSTRAPHEAFHFLEEEPDPVVALVLTRLPPPVSLRILQDFRKEGREEKILSAASESKREQWRLNASYPADSVGALMELPHALFRPGTTVGEAIELLREMVKHAFVTYGYVTDEEGKLIGVLVMRELLLARPEDPIDDLMLRNPFFLTAGMPLADAMRAVLNRHFPVYPVCDEEGRIVGEVRGYALFEQQTVEISAQAGRMVGVEREERVSTPWQRSLRFRHPWLQLNLLTAFVAAGVVGAFQGTIDRIVILAVFLPVLAGQSGNTGCQALAVTLRAMTLGELKAGREKIVLLKEVLLGLWNGVFVGATAGLGMYVYARMQHNPHAPMLGLVVLMAMTLSCIVSGAAGVLIPVTLKRVGADPATASSIFLTTATDVCSMGVFLWLATHLIGGQA